MCIAQVGSEIPKTTGMIWMTTHGGTVHQLMGSDDQHDLPVFPIVVAYNRINHFAPTQYVCDTSLADWHLAQMYRHLQCAQDYFAEAEDNINNPPLSYMLLKLAKQMEGVKLSIQERAKRGLFAASNTPLICMSPGQNVVTNSLGITKHLMCPLCIRNCHNLNFHFFPHAQWITWQYQISLKKKLMNLLT